MKTSSCSRVVPFVLILGLVVVGLAITGCGDGIARSIEVGERAPDFSLTALDGSRQSLAAFRGQPLVLNFWATWCQPCHQEIPDLRALDESGQIPVLSVAIDEQGAEIVRPFVEEQSIGYPVLIDDRGIFAETYGGVTIPFTLILDAEHVIRKIYRSPVEEEGVLADLARLSSGVGAIGS
ncbi:MAG: TlpA disulfide reductase family protein [Acidobacteriota bacterium]